MTMKFRARYEVDIQPVQISWTEELVDEEESGNFYVRLTPHVDEVQKMEQGSVGLLGAATRSKTAAQGRRIFAELKEKIAKEVEKKARAEYNKRRGQRWNKKV